VDLNDPKVMASLRETAENLIRATKMLRDFKNELEAFVTALEESVYGRPVPPKPRLSLVPD
jgi:hypothetical protein